MLLWIATILSSFFFFSFFLFQNYLCQFYFFNIELVKNLGLYFFPLKYCGLLRCFPTWFFYFSINKAKICGESTVAFLTCYCGLLQYFLFHFFWFFYNTFPFFFFLPFFLGFFSFIFSPKLSL